jgi:hypothetical protein
VTNTNWQGYSGESTMSYLTQMLALAVQNFLSAATGIAVAYALIRGFARRSAQGIGNFWVDLTRSTLYVLLPLCLIVAVLFMGQGVIQNFDSYRDVHTLEPLTYDNPQVDAAGQPLKDAAGNPITVSVTTQTQTLPMGPVASQEAIKMLGTNGGGFFNANSAHPYENPTPFSNFVQMISMFLIPDGAVFRVRPHGRRHAPGLGGARRDDLIFVVMATLALWAEQQGNPLFTPLGVDQQQSALQAGGNMEGKETRFGIVASALFATITTSASCGAVNSMHDSFTPLGGLVPMWLIQLGEVVFGGVGAGLYGMLIFAIMAVFIAGLMIGRTPEYVGKKIEVIRNENDLDRHSGHAVPGVGRHRDRGDERTRKSGHPQPGRARLLGDPLRAVLGEQQQRQRVRRHQREHAVLQYAARGRHVVRPIRIHRAGARDRRLARQEESASRSRPARCRPTGRCSSPARRHRRAGRCADLRAGARARAGHRAFAAARDSLRLKKMVRKSLTLFDRALLGPAIIDSFRKLSPAVQIRNPVMFVVYVGSILTTLLFVQSLRGAGEASAGFICAISAWLWFTVLFANFAEALAEGRSKRAGGLAARTEAVDHCQEDARSEIRRRMDRDARAAASQGGRFLVEAGDVIPADGEVVDGVASVDESSITGESAPVCANRAAIFPR